MHRAAAGLACLALGLAGCGAPGPSATQPTSPPLVAQADRTREVPTPARRQSVVGGWRTPAQAVAVFAATYVNWTAATVSVRLRALAEVSVGQARAAMLLAAAETAGDYELHRSGVANRGTVEAVAPLPASPGRYVVVTREQTTSAAGGTYRGLAPAWHVTLATVTRLPVAGVAGRLWVLSGWQAES